MADTSGSMTSYNYIPYATSIGLAIYIAERNHGIFKDNFMSFSSEPKMQQVIGKNIVQKVNNIKSEITSTNIDKAFELLIETAKENNIKEEEMPTHLIIISDMEFDMGVYSSNNTNLFGWKMAFKNAGYKMPKVIFWNVAADTLGMPATKYEEDVIMVSGFSTAILDELLDLENFTPIDAMMAKLEKYIEILNKEI